MTETASPPKLFDEAPPRAVTRSLAWALTWRILLLSLACDFGMKALRTAVNDPPAQGGGFDVLALLVIPIWFGGTYFIFKYMPGRNFAGYRLVFLSPEGGAALPVAPSPSPRALMGASWGLVWRSALWSVFYTCGAVMTALFFAKLLETEEWGLILLFALMAVLAFSIVWVTLQAVRGVMGKVFDGHRLVFLTPDGIKAFDAVQVK